MAITVRAPKATKSARAGKRGNREGSITKRQDGRWEARVTLENGKRKSFYAQDTPGSRDQAHCGHA